MRTWKVGKTRQRKPKITLYLDGRIVLCQPVATVPAGNALGRAWAASDGQ
jgi:hypothetical protein